MTTETPKPTPEEVLTDFLPKTKMYRNLRIVEIRTTSEETASRVLNALRAISKRSDKSQTTQDA